MTRFSACHCNGHSQALSMSSVTIESLLCNFHWLLSPYLYNATANTQIPKKPQSQTCPEILLSLRPTCSMYVCRIYGIWQAKMFIRQKGKCTVRPDAFKGPFERAFIRDGDVFHKHVFDQGGGCWGGGQNHLTNEGQKQQNKPRGWGGREQM